MPGDYFVLTDCGPTILRLERKWDVSRLLYRGFYVSFPEIGIGRLNIGECFTVASVNAALVRHAEKYDEIPLKMICLGWNDPDLVGNHMLAEAIIHDRKIDDELNKAKQRQAGNAAAELMLIACGLIVIAIAVLPRVYFAF